MHYRLFILAKTSASTTDPKSNKPQAIELSSTDDTIRYDRRVNSKAECM